MQKISPLLFSCVMLLGVFSLSSCSPSDTRADDPEQTLHISVGAEPQSLDPHLTSGVPAKKILAALMESLVSFNLTTHAIEPAGATHWDISEDGLTYTFYLRKEAKWSNGDNVTASDYVFSWQRALSPKLGHHYVQDFFAIQGAEDFYTGKQPNFSNVGIKALNEHTIEFTLARIDPLFLKRQTDLPPLHPATILKHGEMDNPVSKWTRPPNFVGNGPFVLTSWEINNVIIAQKNPHYWDAKNVKLEKIYIHTVEDTAAEERMFRSGQLDLAYGGRIPTQKKETYLKEKPEQIKIIPLYGTYFYIFNTQKAPFNDINIRKAFAYSVDRNLITHKIVKSGHKPTPLLSPASPLFNPVSPLVFDPKKAQAFLKAANIHSQADLPAFELTYNTDDLHKKIAVALQQMWKQHLNLDITMQNMEWKIFLASRKNGDHTLARGGSISTFLDPIDFLQSYTTGHGLNDAKWSNPEFDKIIQEAQQIVDTEKRLKLLEKAEQLLHENAVVIPIYSYTESYLISKRVKGAVFSPTARPSYKTLYIDTTVSQ